jgi:hypothetical protein
MKLRANESMEAKEPDFSAYERQSYMQADYASRLYPVIAPQLAWNSPAHDFGTALCSKSTGT